MKHLKNGVDLRVTIKCSSLKSVLDLQFPAMEYQLDNQVIQMSRLMDHYNMLLQNNSTQPLF